MKTYTKKWNSLAAGIFSTIVILFLIRTPLSKTLPNSSPLENQTSSICLPDLNQGFSCLGESALQAVANISTIQIMSVSKDRQYGAQFSSHHFSFDDEDLPSDLHEPLENPHEIQSSGTGFVIQSDHNSAYIVTNYHVIAEADKITVSLNDHTELEATILGLDRQADLAVLKVNTNHLPVDRRKLAILEWADPHLIQVGDFVLAIGNSFGFGSTVSHGIISNLSRRLNTPQTNRSYIPDYIQHSAPIHAGNSGGPLLNSLGKVIGINTVIISSNGDHMGISLSIPASVASTRIKQLIEFGRIRSGWLGIKTQHISGDALLNLDRMKDYKIVGSVTPFGPGAKAKIMPGDVILEFDGKEITGNTNLSQLICETPVGRNVNIKLYRQNQNSNGQILTVTATLEELEENPSPNPPFEQPTKINLINT